MKCSLAVVMTMAALLFAGTAWSQDTFKKAVYYDANQTQGWTGVTAREAIHDYFVGEGYEDLDTDGVRQWMLDRIRDKVPSVIVMSQDIYPSSIVEMNDTQVAPVTTIRQYLDAGGKVVHLSDWPFYYVVTDGVNVTTAGGGATAVLGFGASDISDSGEEVTITPEGKTWGLTQTWLSKRALNADKADVVLASIQDGAGAAAWVRRFALMPSSGFVRLWDTDLQDLVTEDVLADIKRVAEYGMTGVSGIGTIKGVVKSQSGNPVVGQNVKVVADFGSATVITDDKGEFSMVAAAGSFKASANGKLVTSSETVDVAVKPGETTNVTINVQAVEPYVYHFIKAKTPITIDGNGDDAAWADAQVMEINKAEQVNGGTWNGPDDLSAVYKAMYDDQYLYILADVTDNVPRVNVHTDGSIWQGDGIETYVGLDAYDLKRTAYNDSRNYQWTIGVGPDLAWKIFRPTPGDLQPPDIPAIEGNMVVKDHAAGQKPGYVIEARMPWSGFPDVDSSLVPPKDGAPAHMTVALNDNDDPEVLSSREKGMIFERTTEAWHDPSTWVRAMWGGSIAPPPPVGVKGDMSGNGKLDIQDVVAGLRIVAGLATATPNQLTAGDLNANGKIDISEVVQVLRAVAGLAPL